ncbi:MAG TPA: phosphoenolpyruvate--protein phosphotransferase [Gammaproteobacteria bacterium]|nr:phosphoenolpyruvate--protein phosphotransferase [Gammaproteobacteria bacterium]
MQAQATTQLTLYSPLEGPVCPLENVPDPVFAGRILGDGVAIDPINSRLTAPCSGRVTQLARTGHALTITTEEGAEILLHLGIETVHLKGQGIYPKVREGDRVNTSDVLIEFDADYIALHAKSLLTVMIVTNGDRFDIIRRDNSSTVTTTTPLLILRERSTVQNNIPRNTATGELSCPVVVALAGGLHARPAARVRETARRFSSQLEIAYDGKRADCLSITALLGLGVSEGEQVIVYARGIDASAALDAMAQTLQTHIETEAISAVATVNTVVSSHAAAGVIKGICASPGLAMGVVVHWDDTDVVETDSLNASHPEFELERLTSALQQVTAKLLARVAKAKEAGRDTEAMIFDAHMGLLDDPQMRMQAQTLIQQGDSAAKAWQKTIMAQCQVLAALPNPLLAARISDLHDLKKQVLRVLMGKSEKALPVLPQNTVLIAEDFTPSDLEAIDRQRVTALCMKSGGPTSHAAIMARSYGIPALVALGDAASQLASGTKVVVDASAGCLETVPNAERIAEVAVRQSQAALHQQNILQNAAAPAVTTDGRLIEVAANIANISDAQLAAAHGADGVGLLRTEFLFLGRDSAPSQQEQVATYQAVINTLEGRPVYIRAIDIGGDKPVAYLPFPLEPNPALGLRGIRILQVHPAVVETQLRALLSIAPLSACRILLPMVTDADDFVRLRTRIDTLAQTLGIKEAVSVGAMIEVPSAALLSSVLAEYADFLSIGTNDLTQYTLAMDRGNPGLASQLDGLHPAVLHLISQTVAGARLHGKMVAVCGALASDPVAVPVLIGLGVNELSVEPGQVPSIKQLVRKLDYEKCAREVKTLLGLASAAAVRAHCRRVWPL